MRRESDEPRRRFLRTLTACGAGAWVLPAHAQETKPASEEPRDEEEHELVTPGEDLMREHGVLNRVLLVYEECARRIDGRQDLDPQVIVGSADLVRKFIEDYHEKLEEEHVFPRLREANAVTDVLDVLLVQHRAGRGLTDRIRSLGTPAALKNEADSRQLAESIRRFIRMYRPHESREDTVVFPALQRLMKPDEYLELGEKFEEREHELFGEGGFQEWVDKVDELEKAVGIYDLAQFTPEIPTVGG
jgi:hemerythrin-like domain-containing protein